MVTAGTVAVTEGTEEDAMEQMVTVDYSDAMVQAVTMGRCNGSTAKVYINGTAAEWASRQISDERNMVTKRAATFPQKVHDLSLALLGAALNTRTAAWIDDF